MRQLTADPKECIWATAWSPDGKQIAFDALVGDPHGQASYNDFQTSEIYTINADGSNLKKLTENHFIEYRANNVAGWKTNCFFSPTAMETPTTP